MDAMNATPRLLRLATLGLCCAAATAATDPSTDPAAIAQLVGAVSLDVMSEASLQACTDMGVPAAAEMRDAWVAWREQHQLAPLRMVVSDLMRRRGSSAPSWERLTQPLRQRVLAEPKPEATCATLTRDWQGPTMDATALYPQAHAVAQALLQTKAVSRPDRPAVAAGAVRGQVLLPTQLPALAAQFKGGWSSIPAEAARRDLGPVLVKGRVERWAQQPDRYRLALQQGARRSAQHIYLGFDAEPWVGRELVLRGVLTSLRDYAATLAEAELVGDTAGLVPSPLPQAPLKRTEVLLQRVMTTPGAGLADKDLAAIVIHGRSDYSNGTRWEEDVRFLLRDGTAYRRTDMPPDQLDVAASRQLEPQQWGRWRSNGNGYDMQDQDFDGRPAGDWTSQQHHAVKPWPPDTRLDGYFSRGTFSGSLVTGGVSSTRAIRFTREGRFERSYSSLGASGGLAAINGAAISASARGDGKGSSSTAGGTVAGPFGTVGATSGTTTLDDGASRRGRYQLGGYVLTLDYDDGHQERLLSFPVHGDGKTVYVGSGSLTRSDR
jgi:hypothetical protein